jgi:hypothetical protein
MFHEYETCLITIWYDNENRNSSLEPLFFSPFKVSKNLIMQASVRGGAGVSPKRSMKV